MTAVDGREATRLCAEFRAATLDHTFGEDVDVHRIGNKMFALVNVDGQSLTLKAAPDDVASLCSEHESVTPGYYMNKKHWITVDLSADFERTELEELISESHRLVLASLPRYLQRDIEAG